MTSRAVAKTDNKTQETSYSFSNNKKGTDISENVLAINPSDSHNLFNYSFDKVNVHDSSNFISTAPVIQPKLMINQPGDKYEQEADAMADMVMRMNDNELVRPSFNPSNINIQRKCAECEEEDEEIKLQRKETNNSSPSFAAPIVHNVLNSSSGKQMDNGTRSFMESRFNHDFSDVRIHDNNLAAKSAESINALAYTTGNNIVFNRGKYSPDTKNGKKLLAHELTHVVQQSGAGGNRFRQSNEISLFHIANVRHAPSGRSILRMVKSDRQYDLLAGEVHDAIYRPGTDEERVYKALQELDRDPTAIDEFMEAYRKYIARVERESLIDLPTDLLIKDIEDDFSGTELEFALQLLNRGTKGAAQRIEAEAPTSEAAIAAAAKRLWNAVEGMGTDDQAIYAVLLPFGRDQGKLQPLREAYKKISHGEDLETRILDEMSGSDLEYAIYLLFEPKRAYEYYLQQASGEFSSLVLGGARSVGTECIPSKGDAFDQGYWKKGNPNGKEMCALLAKAGDRPSEAVTALFEYVTASVTRAVRGVADLTVTSPTWRVDCAEWVQIHHLYAMLKLLGSYRFDLQFGGAKSEFWLKEHRSTGLSAKMFFVRPGSDTDTRRASEELVAVKLKDGAPEKKKSGDYDIATDVESRDVDTLLREAPVGSRVMWTNVYLVGQATQSLGGTSNPFTNENAIKLGGDSYGAHGFVGRKVFARAELEAKLANEGKPSGMSTGDAVQKYIVIREIEFYSTPAEQPWEKVAKDPQQRQVPNP